jgi:hypothetical protein
MAVSSSVRDAVRARPDFVPCDCEHLAVWQRLNCICKHNDTNTALMNFLRVNWFTPEQLENDYWFTLQSVINEVALGVLRHVADHSRAHQYYPDLQNRMAANLAWRDSGDNPYVQQIEAEEALLFGENYTAILGIQQLRRRHIIRDLKEAFADTVSKLKY